MAISDAPSPPEYANKTRPDFVDAMFLNDEGESDQSTGGGSEEANRSTGEMSRTV